MCWSMGLVCGSSIALFCRRMNTSISSPLFGRTGVPGGSLFRPWQIGGREESLTYCKDRASRRRARRATLVCLVDHWKHQVDNGVVSCLDPYQSPLAELEHMDHVKAEGARVRVLVQWIEDGKASTAFFFRRDRKQSADRWIPALRGADNVVCTDVDGIGAVLITSKNNSA